MEFTNRKGQVVPYSKFKVIETGIWRTFSTDEVFSNRRVIVFALPGAFTPTCSSAHLPRYDQLAPEFYDRGIDDIYALSVNDTFVMNAWFEQQGVQHVKALPDGMGDFTRAMDMLLLKKDVGFGYRSWRYAMIVNNGIIEEMFIEPYEPGDPFVKSDAYSVMRYLDEGFSDGPKYLLITKEGCPHCAAAKAFMSNHSLTYQEMVVGKHLTSEMAQTLSGKGTYPMIFKDGLCIGGKEELLKSIG